MSKLTGISLISSVMYQDSSLETFHYVNGTYDITNGLCPLGNWNVSRHYVSYLRDTMPSKDRVTTDPGLDGLLFADWRS